MDDFTHEYIWHIKEAHFNLKYSCNQIINTNYGDWKKNIGFLWGNEQINKLFFVELYIIKYNRYNIIVTCDNIFESDEERVKFFINRKQTFYKKKNICNGDWNVVLRYSPIYDCINCTFFRLNILPDNKIEYITNYYNIQGINSLL